MAAPVWGELLASECAAGVSCSVEAAVAEWELPLTLTVWARGVSEALEATEAGEPPRVVSEGTCPDVDDSSLGGSSTHTSVFCLLGVSGSTVAAFDDGASWWLF